MRHLDGRYTQRFKRKNGRDGGPLRGRYKAIVVDRVVSWSDYVPLIWMC